MTTSPGYEFNPSQNELFEDLAKKMNLVGILLFIGGILSLIMGIFGYDCIYWSCFYCWHHWKLGVLRILFSEPERGKI